MQRYNIFIPNANIFTNIYYGFQNLFVPLMTTSKVLTFDNKNKNFVICFVLFSLIRTFDDKIVNI